MGRPDERERGLRWNHREVSLRSAAAWSVVVLGLTFSNSSADLNLDAPRTESPRFSKEWFDQFLSEETRCIEALNAYQWRAVGIGSNMNALLASWGKAIGMDSRRDVAVVLARGALPSVECQNKSSGHATRGWSCIFGQVPHLCIFSSLDEWKQSVTEDKLTREDYEEAFELPRNPWTQKYRKNITQSLESPSTDARGVLAVLITLIFKSRQPWVVADIQSVLSGPSMLALRKAPYIALHIRRSDKTAQFPRYFHDVEEYLKEAASAVQALDSDVSATNGIWISTDDSEVINAVKREAPKYLPRINGDLILSVSFEPVDSTRFTTHSSEMTYSTMVGLLAEIQMVAEAEVFVGTFSSNLGKMLAILRDGMGHERSTTVSLDKKWRLGSN